MSARSVSSQHGATLVVSLIMLTITTLLALSMMRLSSTNMRVVGNMQTQQALVASAQQAIEGLIGSSSFYNDQINGTGPWAGGQTTYAVAQTINGYTVTLNKPKCLSQVMAQGTSAVSGLVPQDTYWEVEAIASDSVSGASADVIQGVKVTLPNGNCVWP
jgi:Tfp pilus assembly protein PilX